MTNEEEGVRGELLDMQKAEKSVWLIRCPALVSRSWSSHTTHTDYLSSSSPAIAKVVVSIDPLRSENDNNNNDNNEDDNNNGDSSSTQFMMELAGTDSENVPKCFSMDMFKDFVPMCVFSQTNQGKVSAEGKVLHKFDMKPHNQHMRDYGKLCRERTKKYTTKSRQLQVIENDRGGHMRPMPGMVGLAGFSSKDKKKTLQMKGSDTKRTRRDRGEMEAIMFKLLERKPNWTLRQLVMETDQPEQFLKDMLKDLCVYNNKGQNQGTYELKPEYKRSTEETGLN
ncbi:hypothetical protein Syun_001054 [Stephania yunnanensis]|uniref:TFIIF beta subunit HTH domain-containing protein n=1 Tax=Stephania yunnanensis TaxID=152371 RepID=A0AAP0LH37_9MAGN